MPLGVPAPWGGLVRGRESGPERGERLVERPPDGYCCGRYASYWNAFLFPFRFSFMLKTTTYITSLD